MPLIRLTLELGNRTPDRQVAQFADDGEFVLMSKDRDFVSSHILKGTPRKLVWVTVGNITNTALEALLMEHIERIVELLAVHDLIEIGRQYLVVHH